MKTLFVVSLVLLSQLSFAKAPRTRRGPLPHERTDTAKMNNTTTGRYVYVGDVPKFEAQELEITVSKLNLTTRVTGHVHQGRIDTYAIQLFLRWKSIHDATQDPVFSFHPLVKISKLAENQPVNTQAWAKIAEQYSSHVLEKTDEKIYQTRRNNRNFSSNEDEDDYKEAISTAYFKYVFDTKESPESVINDDKKLENLLSSTNSRRLFEKHLGHLFTSSTKRVGYVGYLTFVYPIAVSTGGPFSQPREMVTDLITAHSMEARWWSDKWNDEFGGFPFLLIDWSGVAFHGPISNFSPLDVWFLRRGYVSHGCHRMDASDLLELRALMPSDLKETGKIKITILDYFDVVDWNKDGMLEVIDVKYYEIPSTVAVSKGKTVEETIRPFMIENQAAKFIKSNRYAKNFYDEESDSFKNIPRYSFQNGILAKDGTHDIVGIYRFEHRPNRIIQYVEEGVKHFGFDDAFGKYPPKYFQRY